jgi:hypothetical protein
MPNNESTEAIWLLCSELSWDSGFYGPVKKTELTDEGIFFLLWEKIIINTKKA